MLSLQVRSTIVAFMLVLLGSAVQASPITIDTFNDAPNLTGYPQHVGVFGLGYDGNDMFGLDPANTVSGHRYGWVDTNDNPDGSYGSADLIVAGGKLGLGTNSVVSPYTAEWGVSWHDGIGPSGGILDLIDDDGSPNTGVPDRFPLGRVRLPPGALRGSTGHGLPRYWFRPTRTHIPYSSRFRNSRS